MNVSLSAADTQKSAVDITRSPFHEHRCSFHFPASSLPCSLEYAGLPAHPSFVVGTLPRSPPTQTRGYERRERSRERPCYNECDVPTCETGGGAQEGNPERMKHLHTGTWYRWYLF